MKNRRIDALQRALGEAALDGMLVGTGCAMAYLLELTAMWFQRTYDTRFPSDMGVGKDYSVRFPDAVLYVPREGEPRLVHVPAREGAFASLDMAKESYYMPNIHYALGKYIAGKRIGVGAWCESFLMGALKAMVPPVEAIPAEHLIDRLRMIKDDREITALRRVAAFTDAAMESTIPLLHEHAGQAELERHLVRFGMDSGLCDVSFPATAMVFSREKGGYLPSDEPFSEGCTVSFDFGYVMDGYCSDFGRSFYSGRAPEAFRDHYRALQTSMQRLVAAIRPNETRIRDIGYMMWDFMADMGCAKYFKNLGGRHSLGHQIGIEVHEHPWIYDGPDDVLKPGMVMCFEPKVSIPGETYIRVEDMVLITETGAELLTKFDRELFDIV